MPEARVAIIGAGYFGAFHFDAWSRLPGARIVAISVPDPAEASAIAIAARYGGDAPLPVFADPSRMVAETAPDIIDITAPPAAHLSLIEALAPLCRFIICQKPFCGGQPGARAAIATAAAHGSRVLVHENIRFQPWYIEARRLIDTGLIGPVYQTGFRLRPGDGRGPRAYLDRQPYFQQMQRFLIHETAIHWIDTFRYLMGEITGVMARVQRRNPAIAGEDGGLVLFETEIGATALFDGNRLADHVADNPRLTMGEMLIEGERGTLRLDGFGRLHFRAFGDLEEQPLHFDWTDRNFGGDCVHTCIAHLLDCWQTGAPSPLDAQSYLRNQIIEDAVYDSAETGRFIAV